MGFEDEVEQSVPRPCRQTDARSKRTCELTSSIVPRGTSFHHAVELDFPPLGFNPARFSCCRRGALLSGPAELGTIDPESQLGCFCRHAVSALRSAGRTTNIPPSDLE